MTNMRVMISGRCSCLLETTSLTGPIIVVLPRSQWLALTPQVDTSSLGHPTAPSWFSIAGRKLFVAPVF